MKKDVTLAMPLGKKDAPETAPLCSGSGFYIQFKMRLLVQLEASAFQMILLVLASAWFQSLDV